MGSSGRSSQTVLLRLHRPRPDDQPGRQPLNPGHHDEGGEAEPRFMPSPIALATP